ncbi:MAG: transglutaminase domain-containing protein [Clostridium sp.]|nr:transglutaminase domain-containing protein [Clostridium sp.]
MKKNNVVEKEIILSKNFHLSSSAYEKWYLKAFLVIMCFFGVFGATFSFITSFDLEIHRLMIITFMILFITIFSAIFFKRKYTNALIIGINIVYILIYFLFKNIVIYGVINICNEVNNKLISITGGILLDISSLVSEEININLEASIGIALIFIMFIITEAVCYSIIYKNNFILLLIVTLPCIEIGVFFAIMPDILPFLMLIICWIVASSFSIFKVSLNNKEEFKYNKRKKKYYYANGRVKRNIKIKSGMILAIISLLLFFIVFLVYPKEKYLGNKELMNTKREMAQYINDAEFKKIFSLFSGSATGGINGGKLGSVESVEYDNKTDLIVKVDQFNDDIYLKGYVGEVYTGRSWNNISSSTYRKYKKLLGDICTQNLNYEAVEQYISSNSYKSYKNLLKDIYNEDLNEEEKIIQIENVGANDKYIYAPYNANYEFNKDIFNFHNDSFVSPKVNKKSYSFYYYPYEFDNDLYTEFDEEYLEKENKYREYVYDVYTKLPEATLSKVREEYEDLGKRDNYSVYDKIELAKEVINNGTSYTLSPGKLPRGKDFVEYFLFENKKGYCTHYASAACVLLRMWGVPARYVEGYLAKSYGANEVNVKDSSAHAWVEVYIDGIGWRIVDATPGYDDENSYATNNIDNQEEQQNNIEKTKNEEEQKDPLEENNKEKEKTQAEEEKSNSLEKSSENNGSLNKFLTQHSGLITVLKVIFKNILLGFLIIIALITIILLRYSYIINKNKKLVNSEDVNENVINMYKYLKCILDYLKKNSKEPLKDEDIIKQDEFNEILRILNKAEFSNHKVSKEESETVRNFVKNFADKTYNELSKIKRLIFKYINVLY